MLNKTETKQITTTMVHFLMSHPLPSMPMDVVDRISNFNLYLEPLKLSYDEILGELKKIGDDWHLRDEHVNPIKKQRTQNKLESDLTSSWHFKRGDLTMGFCVAVKTGFNGELESTADRYGLDPSEGTEIYKVGLYPEFTNKGYGHSFLPLIQSALMKGQKSDNPDFCIEPSDFIYLNTRPDSNAVNSVNFYKTLGYKESGVIEWPIPTEEFNRMNKERVRGRAFTPRSSTPDTESANTNKFMTLGNS